MQSAEEIFLELHTDRMKTTLSKRHSEGRFENAKIALEKANEESHKRKLERYHNSDKYKEILAINEFYKIDYENISFLYYDNENKIARIVIEGNEYKIVDNDITVGSSYEEIINAYGEPESSVAYFNENRTRNEIQLKYSTQGTALSYFEVGSEYYFSITINIDAETKTCSELFVTWRTPC